MGLCSLVQSFVGLLLSSVSIASELLMIKGKDLQRERMLWEMFTGRLEICLSQILLFACSERVRI